MQSFIQYITEITPEIASRLAGARAKHGQMEKSRLAKQGAKKRAKNQLTPNSDFFRPNPKEKAELDKRMQQGYDIGLKSGRVTSQNVHKTKWSKMKNRPDRILSHDHRTAY